MRILFENLTQKSQRERDREREKDRERGERERERDRETEKEIDREEREVFMPSVHGRQLMTRKMVQAQQGSLRQILFKRGVRRRASEVTDQSFLTERLEFEEVIDSRIYWFELYYRKALSDGVRD